ncbi:FUSC family protein [Thermomonospora umbrina]|uniref:FUSC family protein n=1 Tax=Thermomonospora umbrina TaxID=111806 RepID=UPI0014771778|nr:FUSC family protein [Thermomonospora umbrina]
MRVRVDAWPVLQSTAAATLAWLIATTVIGNAQPFFAPIAAVVALNVARGGRGSNAVRLLTGTGVGIVVAEIALWIGSVDTWTLAIATFTAMSIAVLIDGTRIVIAQAAGSAILTVAVGSPDAGFARLMDALVGAGVALVFSQILFPAEPIRLLRRAESAVLTELGEGLDYTARALIHYDDEYVTEALDNMREANERLAELGSTRRGTGHVARRSPLWWGRVAVIVRAGEDAGQLDLLGSSCFTLARMALAADRDDRPGLGPPVRDLAVTVAMLARAPGDRDVRRRAAHRAVSIVRMCDLSGTASTATVRTVVRMAATDVLLYTGVDVEAADDVERSAPGVLHVDDDADKRHFGRGPR